MESQAVWNTVEFILNGFVFILIGLQLPRVLDLMRPLDWPRLLAGSAFISLLLLGLRMAWIYPVAYLAGLYATAFFASTTRSKSTGAGRSSSDGLGCAACLRSLPLSLCRRPPMQELRSRTAL